MNFSKLFLAFASMLAALLSTHSFAGDLPDDVMKSTTPTSSAEAPVTKTESPAPAKKTATLKRVKGESAPAAAQTAEMKALKTLDTRYQKARSVTMDVDKTLVLGLLGKEKKSKGHILLSRGKMRLEINAPDKSLVVVNGNNLWVADYPPAEFKNASVQVLKGQIDSKKGTQQGFVGLLTRGGVLKHFDVAGVQRDDQARSVYFLIPTQKTFEFRRAQMTLSADGRYIAELRYWDERDNETRMQFSNVKFDVPVVDTAFEFVPPENADITTL
ncbi:MAG: outer membrane lipoprotein carrier protein LolA [Bdellovibrionaceae bacterium]|nr:outer membrane lipoprotein carrier protein LolA [Pseudobdellovibrionaceae bacterium]